MLKDLCVTEIRNVYQNDTLTWSRKTSANRNRSGLVLFTEGEIEYYLPNHCRKCRIGDAFSVQRSVSRCSPNATSGVLCS